MDLRNRVKQLLKMCGHAFLSTLHERLDVLERQARNASFPETQAALLQASIHTVEKLHELTDHVVVETSDDRLNHPEAGLMEFLYSYLPTRKAVAARAEMAEWLRAIGYEVCVLENGREIPSDAGLVILNASLEPTQQCGSPVAVVAYRDTLDRPVREMRNQGYRWHIVLYRVPGGAKVAYYANYTRAAPGSCGNVFFFRDYGVFSQAEAWCSAVLPRTYFKPANSKNSTTESMPRE